MEFLVISPVDFETDEEFGKMYKYLTREELTGHSRTDKTTLIMSVDRYIIESGLLYKIDVPRQKIVCAQKIPARDFGLCA